jgi:GNAT superfamily N-acetyltransferase
MFASPQLAACIDRAEGRLCAGIARAAEARTLERTTEVIEIAGGVAVFAGRGSPTNKMIGIGFDELPAPRALDRVERAFARRHEPLQAEVSTLADPALHASLMQRGYATRGFENVLGHSLAVLDSPAPPSIHISRADPGDMPEWVDVVAAAFASPDVGGVGGDAIPPPDELRAWVTLTMSVSGFEAFVARFDGKIVGGGSLRIDAGVAQLCGAGTLPAFRRRGIQTALLRWRLAYARQAGCEVAVVTTQPASKSQENVQREGFQLLYARQLLVKAP